MNPLLRFSSSHSFSACSSVLDSKYSGTKGGVNPSRREILWSYGRCGGKALATASKNNGRNSWYSLGM